MKLEPLSPAASRRQAAYNAQVAAIHRIHDDLMVLRIRPDQGKYSFEPGQYVVLGRGYWEPRIAAAQPEVPGSFDAEKVVKRAYSVSCRLVDDAGQLCSTTDDELLEFYIVLVREAAKPPVLTPRLFCLEVGDRLFLGPRPHGHYTLAGVGPEDNVVFVATGTGEAPHNAMSAALLRRGHRGRIASITCVREKRDLGYWKEQRQLEKLFANYRYIGLTTREPENLDRSRPDYVGKRYVQDLFASPQVANFLGFDLQPERTHVFLCGNPLMIGAPFRTADPAQRYPTPTGMVEVLEMRGFHVDEPHRPGNIHFEKYW